MRDERGPRRCDGDGAGRGCRGRGARQSPGGRRQVALRAEHLYDGDVDGRAGPQTGLAVRAFQRRERLAVDGVAGAATRRALGRRGCRPTRPG